MKSAMIPLAVILLATLAGSARALNVGDDAPALELAKWVKGEPVVLADGKGKNVFVVEFWATWCPPCKVSIPHLSKLQREYKDQGLIVIGISNEEASKVESFVAEQKEMEYRVAVDGGKTSEVWMKDVSGIPHAFIVDKNGKICWAGHPLSMEPVLKKVLAGKYGPGEVANESRKKELIEKTNQALRARKMAEAEQFLAELVSLEPSELRYGLSYVAISRQNAKDLVAGKAAYSKWAAAAKGDSDALCVLAQCICRDEEGFNLRPLDIALECASSAVEITGGKDGDALKTMALVKYNLGLVDAAAADAKKACELDPEDSDAKAFLAHLTEIANLAAKAPK